MTSSPPPTAAAAAPRMRWAAAAVCALGGLLLFQFFGNASRGYIDSASLFYWWGFQWANPRSETEHGWLVLALSAWLLWRNLRRDSTGATRAGSLRDALAGGGAMLLGLALHVAGFAAQQARLSIVALLVFTWGVLRLGGGPHWGRAAAFPVAFMVFAIPINALDSIGFWLRVWVVDASAAIARGAGIAVLQNGTQLTSPDGTYHYDVVAACSGIRSLTAMTALSLLAGYLNFSSWTRRLLVLVLCFPLVYLGNVARILAIIFAAEAGGPAWGSIAHEVMGFGVFAIVLGGVLAAIAALRRGWPERAPDAASAGPAEAVAPRSRLAGPFTAACVGAAAAGAMLFLQHLASLPPRGGAGVRLAADGLNPVELPSFLGTEWIGQRAEVTAFERATLPEDTGFSRRRYVPLGDPQRAVFLSIVLSGRDRTSIHRPELCLVGQGWSVLERLPHRFRFAEHPDGGFGASVLRVRREVNTPRGKIVVPELTAYWFVSADAIVPTHARMFWRDAWQRLTRARADRWAYVLLQTDASDGEAAALARMQAVLDATLPVFQPPRPGTPAVRGSHGAPALADALPPP